MIINKLMLIMQCCQPLVLIFQFFKIFEQRTLALLSLNPGSVPSEEDEACLQAMLLSSTRLFSSVLNKAIKLDLFGIIARVGLAACMTPSEIASQLPTQDSNAPSRLDCMFHLLACHSLLTCFIRNLEDGRFERLYGLTPASHFFFEKKDEGSLAPFLAYNSH